MKKLILIIITILLFCSCRAETASPSQSVNKPVTNYKKISPLPAATLVQTIYVPIYSHIYYQNETKSINLTATLSIRNSDENNPIIIANVRYFDTNGKLIKKFLTDAVELPALATLEYVIDEEDSSGGSGANFLVDWQTATTVSEPVIEAVMISTRSNQGISFISEGRVIKSITKEKNQ